MKRPTDINVVIGIGIFAFVAIAAYWFFWFVVPGWCRRALPPIQTYAVYDGI